LSSLIPLIAGKLLGSMKLEVLAIFSIYNDSSPLSADILLTDIWTVLRM
jgi:hypothetical protein